jgi:hypothetical protein
MRRLPVFLWTCCALQGCAQSAPATPDLYAKQGYSKEQSATMLDPKVRTLLDASLRLYRENGLFANRSEALKALGVTTTTRRWMPTKPEEGSHPDYEDTFAKEGLFARPAWKGQYNYNGVSRMHPGKWHSVITVYVDAKKECHDSRAVEGYLDLMLDPGSRGYVHPVPERLQRHQVPYASPYAVPLTPATPMLSFAINSGCLASLTLARLLNLKEINDDHAHN